MNSIKLISKESSFKCNPKTIDNFGVSFDLIDTLEMLDLEQSKLTLTYNINLYEGKKVNFGSIRATYSFILPENINIINIDENTKRTIILYCLKLNHFNIQQLIKTEINKNGFKIKENKMNQRNLH